VELAVGLGREDHQDEGWPHASRAQAEHAVDLETGAIVAVTIQGADAGDAQRLPDTLSAAVTQLDQITDADGEPVALDDEVVAENGCQSCALLHDLRTHGFRTNVSESDRGPQSWIAQADAREPCGPIDRGMALPRQRGERVERGFAHPGRHGRDAAALRARRLQHSQARARARERLQARDCDAPPDRRRDATRPSRAAGAADDDTCGHLPGDRRDRNHSIRWPRDRDHPHATRMPQVSLFASRPGMGHLYQGLLGQIRGRWREHGRAATVRRLARKPLPCDLRHLNHRGDELIASPGCDRGK
jgi:hypothetical protein